MSRACLDADRADTRDAYRLARRDTAVIDHDGLKIPGDCGDPDRAGRMRDPVLDLLARRAASGSRSPHCDGASLALCIEGGSMRGVVSAGMALGLEQLGLLSCFDVVYGSSAGAMNGAYFLAGQAAFGTTIYYDNLNNRHFIDFLRPLRRRPVVDLDFVVTSVMLHQKPLDTSRVIDSPVPLVAIATDAATGERAAFRRFEDGRDLRRALRAGATMPVVAGPPYPYHHGYYFDALLTEPIPVPIAEAEGHTHILALLTRPYREGVRQLSLVEKLLVVRQLERVSPNLARRYLGRAAAYSELLRAIAGGTGPTGRAQVSVIRPLGPVVSKLERRRQHLIAGAARGLEAVMSAIGSHDVRPVETLAAFDAKGHKVQPRESPLKTVAAAASTTESS